MKIALTLITVVTAAGSNGAVIAPTTGATFVILVVVLPVPVPVSSSVSVTPIV